MICGVALQTAPLNVCTIRFAIRFLRALHLSIPYQVRDKLLSSPDLILCMFFVIPAAERESRKLNMKD